MPRWLSIVWVVVEALLVLCTCALWVVATEYTVLNVSVTLFTVLLGVVLFYPRRTGLLVWLKSRQAKSAANQLGGFALWCAITALVCYLAWKFPWQKDLSERSLNTLSAQSQQITRDLPADTKLTLYARRQDWSQAMALLRLYGDQRSDLSLSAVDPETQPQAARAAGVQDPGTVVVEGGGKRVSFVLKDELSVTNALLKMVRERHIRVFFSVGHGEAGCESQNPEGLSALCRHLQQQHYETHRLDLSTVAEVPNEADVVVVWGPTAALLPQEVARLQRYLEKGGALAFLYSPNFQQDVLGEMRGLVAKWGLIARNDLVVDSVSTLETQEATIPLVSKYAQHPVTRGFTARTLFPLSSSVGVGEPLYQGVAVTPLAMTSPFPGSWAESDLAGIAAGKANFTEGKDHKGPIALLAVAERLPPEGGTGDTRVAVFGNDAFARNAWQNQTANMNLLLNVLGWLAHDEGLVSLNRPGLSHEAVIISAQHRSLIFIVTVVAVPVCCFILALWVYRRRRKL